jgi:hypothetical protein
MNSMRNNQAKDYKKRGIPLKHLYSYDGEEE